MPLGIIISNQGPPMDLKTFPGAILRIHRQVSMHTTFLARNDLKDGDTLICDGVAGKFFEVTPDGTTVWQWTNPYPNPNMNDVFKIVYIPPDEPPPPHKTIPLI